MALREIRHSVIIPTLDRQASLARCLHSLQGQVDEIITVTERGALAALRNVGARRAQGQLISFLDDDVVVAPSWASAVRRAFARPHVVGVSGPAVIPLHVRGQRDLFRYRWRKALYDAIFLGDCARLPGHLTRAGTWTTGACEEDCDYEGPVHFLEACNQTWQAGAFWSVGGYDESYGGIGDWSEPDLALRVRTRFGGMLWFSRRAAVTHYPDRTGAFLQRGRTGTRLTNYDLFSRRWVRPHWSHTAFCLFLKSYYGWQELKWRFAH